MKQYTSPEAELIKLKLDGELMNNPVLSTVGGGGEFEGDY